MVTFILVHGSFHGGWAWREIEKRLIDAGHQVLAPDLPGMGEDGIASADVTLSMTGGFIAELAQRQAQKVVLVGHSFGGATVSFAAELAPEAISGLVYVTAVLLPSGASATDIVMRMGRLPDGVTESAGGTLHTIARERARARYYRNCSIDDQEFALAKLRPQPTGPMRDRMIVTPGRFGKIPRAYIECAQDDALPLDYQRALHAAMPCDPVFTMQTGHSPFLEDPDGLTTNLINAATTFELRRVAAT